jgi:hypothetical protein
MFYFYRALVWAGRVGISCTINSARILRNKLLCSKYSSESDFTTTERVHLNRFTVPCDSDSAVQSLPQPPDTPSFDPLLSVLTAEDDLHVLTPTKTYSKTLVPSTITPIPIHVGSPSTSLQMSAIQPSPAAASTFAVKETSFPLSCLNVNAFDGELGHINRCSKPQRSSSYR